MIEALSPQIKSMILDMDGVLWRGSTPLVDMPSFFAKIRSRGLKVILATNNATRDPETVLDTLHKFGANEIETWQVVTSSMAVTYMLQHKFPQGGPVYVVGESGLVNALKAGGFYPADEQVLAVVAGLDRALTYDKLKRSTLLIRAGALFYGTNPDKTFPAQEGLLPGAGSVLAAIETASGVSPLIAGKPQLGMFELALERLGTRPEETLVVGDRLDTDILGGQRAGCRTALVLTGVSTAEQAGTWQPHPDLVVANASDLIA